MNVIHKQAGSSDLWSSPNLCGAYPIVSRYSSNWRKVTCKRCLKRKTVNGRR